MSVDLYPSLTLSPGVSSPPSLDPVLHIAGPSIRGQLLPVSFPCPLRRTRETETGNGAYSHRRPLFSFLASHLLNASQRVCRRDAGASWRSFIKVETVGHGCDGQVVALPSSPEDDDQLLAKNLELTSGTARILESLDAGRVPPSAPFWRRAGAAERRACEERRAEGEP